MKYNQTIIAIKGLMFWLYIVYNSTLYAQYIQFIPVFVYPLIEHYNIALIPANLR
jgi:hypothetical protein